MWAVAGVLLGVVVVASLVGFHAGPHVHVFAGGLGLLAAGWLVAIGVSGHPWPGVWVLLTADVVITVGVGWLAWHGFRTRAAGPPVLPLHALEAAPGVAVTALTPEGVVRVRGEDWSAVAVNGTAPVGRAVQVLGHEGVRLEVWVEDAPAEPHPTDSKGHPS